MASYDNWGALRSVIISLPAVFMAIILYWIGRRIWLKYNFKDYFKKVRKRGFLNETIRLLLFAWFAELVAVIFLPPNLWENLLLLIEKGSYWASNDVLALPGEYRINLIPMVVQVLINQYIELSDIAMFLANIAIFIPLGLALPFIFKKSNLLKIFLSGLVITLTIELIHPFFYGRSGDIDDVIANALGAVMGYFLYLFLNKLFPSFSDKCKISVIDAFDEVLETNIKEEHYYEVQKNNYDYGSSCNNSD
ncbi:MAG: VanZ family protein [Ruminiclostridium sp.]|nr:VanZ family protein [Ruminococcus sp.]MBP3856910.1 VanZ family protein [Ruminiclostridium sp.]